MRISDLAGWPDEPVRVPPALPRRHHHEPAAVPETHPAPDAARCCSLAGRLARVGTSSATTSPPSSAASTAACSLAPPRHAARLRADSTPQNLQHLPEPYSGGDPLGNPALTLPQHRCTSLHRTGLQDVTAGPLGHHEAMSLVFDITSTSPAPQRPAGHDEVSPRTTLLDWVREQAADRARGMQRSPVARAPFWSTTCHERCLTLVVQCDAAR